MYWPLQENFLDTKTVNDLCYFIKSNNRLTQFRKLEILKKISQNGMVLSFQFLLTLEVQLT